MIEFHSRRAWEWTVARADVSKTWIEVGPFHGHYTLRMCMKAQHVVAFEAHEGVAAQLAHELRKTNNLTIVPVALGAATGMAPLWTHDLNDWGQDHTLSEDRARIGGLGHRMDRTTEVQQFALDDWLGFNGIETVGLIKINAPGSELAVIEGSRETLTTHKPVISFKVYPPTDGARLFDLLTELGYTVSCDGVTPADSIPVAENDQGWVAWPN